MKRLTEQNKKLENLFFLSEKLIKYVRKNKEKWIEKQQKRGKNIKKKSGQREK